MVNTIVHTAGQTVGLQSRDRSRHTPDRSTTMLWPANKSATCVSIQPELVLTWADLCCRHGGACTGYWSQSVCASYAQLPCVMTLLQCRSCPHATNEPMRQACTQLPTQQAFTQNCINMNCCNDTNCSAREYILEALQQPVVPRSTRGNR